VRIPERDTPTLTSLIEGAIGSRIGRLDTVTVGRIESYDASTRRAAVKPMIMRHDVDEDGERVAVSRPVFQGVPVLLPGAGGARLTFPISAGDYVLLVFADSIDAWLGRGGEVDPGERRQRPVAIPGIQPFSGSGAASDATPQIEITSTEVRAGGDQALATKADLDALKAAISGAAVSGGDGGATFKANILAALATWPTGTTVLKGS
jgi:hypothetical protein